MKKTMKELTLFKGCPRSYKLSQFGLTTEKNGNFFKAIAAKKIVMDFLKLPDAARVSFFKTVRSALEAEIPMDAIPMLSRKSQLDTLSERIVWYLQYLCDTNATMVHGPAKRDLKVKGKLIEVSCDYILSIEGRTHVVVLKTGKPHLSPQGRSKETKTDYSFELFLLTKLGEAVLGSPGCDGAFHHLRLRGVGEQFEFNQKGNISIAKNPHHFTFHPEVEDIIVNTISSMDAGVDSCETSNCRTCSYKSLCSYNPKEKLVLETIEEAPSKAANDFALTQNQQKAVASDAGIIRVNAGAGSGKTTVVALRLSDQIMMGANPEKMLLITFTDKGAGEMREKVKYWLDKEGMGEWASKINIETFNSFGSKMIKKHYKELGFTEEPKLLDKVQKYMLIDSLLCKHKQMEGYNYEHSTLNFVHAQGVIVKVAGHIDYIKAMGPTDLPSITPDPDTVLAIYNEFNEELLKRNLIEYQDQIRFAVGAFENEYTFLKEYDYEHIVIDEFQDTDSAQLDLMLYLSNQPSFKSLMIVGDDSQSIYGFRYTSQENILNFDKYFDEVKDIQLTENFRSTKEILELANYINDLNVKKIRKKLIPSPKTGPMPTLKLVKKNEEEVGYIVKGIQEKLSEGWNPEDIAFIARTRNELIDVHNALKAVGVPSVVDVPEPIIKHPLLLPIQNLMASISNPDITMGFADYLNVIDKTFMSLDVTVAKKMVEEMKKEMNAKLDCTESDKIDEMQRKVFEEMVGKMVDDEMKLFIDELLNMFESFEEMKAYLDKFIEYEDGKVVTEKTDIKHRAVTLITVHASKGKEYEIVFNSLRNFKGGEGDELEEERRTLFVSITRAKKELYLSAIDKSVVGKKNNNSVILREVINCDKVRLK